MPRAFLDLRNSFEGTYTLLIVGYSWDLLLRIGPYLLASLAISVVVSRWMRRRQLLFSASSELVTIVIAALVGLLSPLPTYAAIPVALSLMPAGVPFSAVLAFVISSPLMNPSIFFLTATQLGFQMAIARTAAAFVLGTVAGLCAMTILKRFFRPCDCRLPAVSRVDNSLITDIWKTLRYAARYFPIAILLSAAVKALVPAQAIADLLGPGARTGTLVAIGLGVPFYTCGGAAIPFAQTLMEMGMGKGAMLAFFVAGPATKLETLYAFKALLGVRVLLFYLGITCAFSCGAGLLFSLL